MRSSLSYSMSLLLLIGATGASAAPDADAVIPLPSPERTGSLSIEQALDERRSVREYRPDPLDQAQIAQLAWAAQGVSDTRRGYRTAPSAGATFPLEVDLLIHGVDGIDDGVYRYLPGEHALQLRFGGDHREALARAALGQAWVREAPVVMVLSAVLARTEGRYGERAERYVHMEAGHAAQNVYLQAVALEIGTVVVGAFDDDGIASVLQLERGEQPLYLLPLGRLP